jgi:hypothetical protein
VNLTEADQLLTVIQNVDKRIIDDAAVVIWQNLLHDLDYDDCVSAAMRHFRASTEYLTPAHIVAGVKVIRDEKRKGTSAPLALAKYSPPPTEQRAINSRGRDLVNRAMGVDPNAQHEKTLDPDCPVRDAALKRAAREKRERARDKAVNPDMSRLVSQATRHIQREN